MAVAARSVKEEAQPANHGVVPMRETPTVFAGAYEHYGDALTTGWHSHDLHQLEYAVHGLVEVDTARGRHLLPSQQAAWIPAGVEHQSIIHTSVRTVSVFFDPTVLRNSDEARVRVLAVPPLLREMILHALHWPIGRHNHDPTADRFFLAFADVVHDALELEQPLALPSSQHPALAAAADYIDARIDTVTVPELCRAVGVSERTLRRLFQTELQMTCRAYLLQARLLRAMVLLAQGHTVLDAATSVGFASGSAFARTFADHCGESPSSYRKRMSAPAEHGPQRSVP